MSKFREFFRKCWHHPLITLLLAVLLCCLGIFAWVVIMESTLYWGEALSCLVIAVFVATPAVLSLYDLLGLVISSEEPVRRRHQRMELLTISFGGLCFLLWSTLAMEIRWDGDWQEALYNSEVHTPIAGEGQLTVWVLAAVALAGYLVLYVARIRPLPPLVTVLGLGGLYLGAGLCVLLIIQLWSRGWVLCVYLVNLLLICARTVKELVLIHQKSPKEYRFPWLNKLLHRGASLPLLGLLAALPLLGILLGVLTLFGQAPDSIIRAWTQTSDWTFSQQVSPPNIRDGHYLCTVAAGGHRRLVKPLRMGKRHGHWVIVNRQLAVANAFEELLAQHLPRLHRLVRYLYDRYGYPISRHIRTPWAADAVWLLMKPAEWFFLVCLYLFDLKPENRIAVQYPHAPIPRVGCGKEFPHQQ